MSLNRLIHPSKEKIQKARKVYEAYCRTSSKKATAAETGLAYNTIRKYVDLIEGINNRNKISTKDRYYNNSNNNIVAPPPDIPLDCNKEIKDCQVVNENNLIDGVLETVSEIESDGTDEEVVSANIVPDLNELKNKLLSAKLTSISDKYLGYLDDPDDNLLRRTSLKDRAVIAGILLDKKILLEHKNTNIVKNQSIIFNLFGDNKNLASFISDSMRRSKQLRDRPVSKYIPAVNK